MAIPSNLVESITDAGFSTPIDVSLLASHGWLTFDVADSGLITNYCARAQDRLIEQFENKQKINDYVCALIKPFQDLEYVYGDLHLYRRLNFASGVQLDGLGDIVGQPRNGLTDEQYREAIRFQVGVNASSGEGESLLALTANLTEATEVKISEQFPAGVVLTTNGHEVSSNTRRLIEQNAAAGVRVELIATYGTIPFAVAPDPGDIDPTPQGFSEPNYAPDAGKGGQLTEKF